VAFVREARLMNSVSEKGNLAINGQLSVSGKLFGSLEANYSPIQNVGLNVFGSSLSGFNSVGGGIGLYKSKAFNLQAKEPSKFHMDAYLNYAYTNSIGKAFNIGGSYNYGFKSNDLSLQLGAHLKLAYFNLDLAYRPHIFDMFEASFDETITPNLPILIKEPYLLHDISCRMGFSYRGFGLQSSLSIPIAEPKNVSPINYGSFSMGMFYNFNIFESNRKKKPKDSIF
jgi:hypothetical protein